MNPKKFLRVPQHGMDYAFLKDVKAKVDALLNAQITDEQGQVVGQVQYAGGNTVYQVKSTAAGGAGIEGEWDPAKTYAAGRIVFFTPDGEAGATFYSLIAVPAGISPDTGAPYWAAFPMSPSGLWG